MLPFIPIRRDGKSGVIHQMKCIRSVRTGQLENIWSDSDIPEEVIKSAEVEIPKGVTQKRFWYDRRDNAVLSKMAMDRRIRTELDMKMRVDEEFQKRCDEEIDAEVEKELEKWKSTTMNDEIQEKIRSLKSGKLAEFNTLVEARVNKRIEEEHVSLIEVAVKGKLEAINAEHKGVINDLKAKHKKAIDDIHKRYENIKDEYVKSDEFKAKVKQFCDEIPAMVNKVFC